MRCDLIAVDSAVDGLRHYVDDRHHAEVLATAVSNGFRAVCGHPVLPESLCAEPRPVCRSCRTVAQRRRCTDTAATPPRHRAWPLRGTDHGRR